VHRALLLPTLSARPRCGDGALDGQLTILDARAALTPRGRTASAVRDRNRPPCPPFDATGHLYIAVKVVPPGHSIWFGDPTEAVALLDSADAGVTFQARLISANDPTTASWLTSLERPFDDTPLAETPGLRWAHGNRDEPMPPAPRPEVRFTQLARWAGRRQRSPGLACPPPRGYPHGCPPRRRSRPGGRSRIVGCETPPLQVGLDCLLPQLETTMPPRPVGPEGIDRILETGREDQPENQ
jgi:hypothetical protein